LGTHLRKTHSGRERVDDLRRHELHRVATARDPFRRRLLPFRLTAANIATEQRETVRTRLDALEAQLEQAADGRG
jgi:hypothetical protein